MSPVRRTSDGVSHLLIGQPILPHGHSMLHGHSSVELGVLLCEYRNVLLERCLHYLAQIKFCLPFSLKHYFANIELKL